MSIALPELVTLAQATGVLAELRHRVQQVPAESVDIDASALRHLDSSCIAVLLQCRREAQARSMPLRLLNAPPKLAALLRLYGVDSLFSGSAPTA